MNGVLGRVGGGQGGGALAELGGVEQVGVAVVAGDDQHVEVAGEIVDPADGVHDEIVGGDVGQIESWHQPHGTLPAEPLIERIGIGPDCRIDHRSSLQGNGRRGNRLHARRHARPRNGRLPPGGSGPDSHCVPPVPAIASAPA